MREYVMIGLVLFAVVAAIVAGIVYAVWVLVTSAEENSKKEEINGNPIKENI